MVCQHCLLSNTNNFSLWNVPQFCLEIYAQHLTILFFMKMNRTLSPMISTKKKNNSHSFATGMLKEMLDWNVGNFHCQYSLPFASQTKKDEMPISIFIMEKFLVYSQIYWGNRDTGTIRHLQSFWFLMRWKSLYYLIFLNKFHYLKGNESWLTEMLHCF